MRHVLAAIAATACLSTASAADIEAGRARAEPCTACHGTEGITADRSIPSLAGQKERYLQWQLVFFRSGRRQSEVMQPQAAELSDEELRNLGAYFASLPPPKPEKDPDPDLSKKGAEAIQPSPRYIRPWSAPRKLFQISTSFCRWRRRPSAYRGCPAVAVASGCRSCSI